MSRFVGAKNGRITLVSDAAFSSYDMEVIQLPEQLKVVSAEELVINYQVRNGKIVSKSDKKPAKQLRVALVSNWAMKCGISTYGQRLFPEVAKHVADVKLFIEENQYPTGDIHQLGNITLPADKVSVCWKRGESLNRLAKEIRAYNPDVILVNHEWGLFSNARYWLSFLTQVSQYRVVVIMHSVFPHHPDKTICEAAMPNIVVHLDGAKQCLTQDKQVPGKVHVISHGCEPCVSRERYYNMYHSQHTFIQQGFLFPYKRFEVSIQAAALLKGKYPDVFFTGLLSESDHNKVGHQVYYDQLMDLVSELGVEDNVALIRGFQSEATLDSYYRTNKVAVFPYGSDPLHEVFGVSGACRTAMTKGIPVITSLAHHFEDVPTIKADTAEQVAMELDKLFSQPKLVEAQINKQIGYLFDNTWQKVALKLIEVLES